MNRAFRPGRLGTLAALAIIMLPATAAFAGVLEDRLQQTRADARGTKSEMAVVDTRQQALVRQVTSLNRRIAELDGPLRELERDVDNLDYRIEQRRTRVIALRAERETQRKEIIRLDAEANAARDLLATRVVAAYKTGDTGLVEQLAGAGSLTDLFKREEALGHVVGLDKRVIERITGAERSVRIKRSRNFELRRQIRDDIDQLARDRADVDGKRATAQRARDEVASVRAARDAYLRKLNSRKEQLGEHLESLEGDAKILEDVIKNGSTAFQGQIGGLTASGIIWPVNGPMISPFGQRWGRLHAGVDIAVGTGTPIHAAASGVVTYASEMSGYGNMVIIQHAGNLATGYAHQSQIATHVGAMVSQGEVIGFVGCTGHCFGPHLHFETRVNGTPSDPMQYLS